MQNFQQIKEALLYIDAHLAEEITFETLAGRFHFSPFYFHRVFSLVVGRTIAVYVRDRRLQRACQQLADTGRPVLDIALDCGYRSAQAFTRAFKGAFGLPPTAYRRMGYRPTVVTVDELIMQFTNRIKGGIYVHPNIIKHGALRIACTVGEGHKTAEVWQAVEKLAEEKPLTNKISDGGYEVRVFDGDTDTVYAGYAVSDEAVDPAYTIFSLPAAHYASFDVYVANGYESENNAMDEWLAANRETWDRKLLPKGEYYCVEYYDERFCGEEAGSIVEIWLPIAKR